MTEAPQSSTQQVASGGPRAAAGYAAVTDADKALAYYRTAAIQTGKHCPRPSFVPSRVRVLCTVTSDLPGFIGERTRVVPGDYECHSNCNGAVSVKSNVGSMLGLRLDEFEVLAWRPNEAA